MEWQNFRSGQVIFREGESSDAAFLIVSGSVRIVRGLDGPDPQTLATVNAGEYIGEMGAIDHMPRSASAVAEGKVVCAPVTPEAFIDMLVRNPDETIDLLKILFERLRAANRRLVELESAAQGRG